MLSADVQQIAVGGTLVGFEPVAEISGAVADELARRGLTFAEEQEQDEPGPTRWALVELRDGMRLLLVHHYAHAEGILEIRAPRSSVTPAMVMARFLHAVDLMPEVYNISDRWSASAT
jgi:hypothetical protein